MISQRPALIRIIDVGGRLPRDTFIYAHSVLADGYNPSNHVADGFVRELVYPNSIIFVHTRIRVR